MHAFRIASFRIYKIILPRKYVPTEEFGASCLYEFRHFYQESSGPDKKTVLCINKLCMNFDFQPTIKNDLVSIKPLNDTDFEALYKVASDPLIWEQHPKKNRYQEEIFKIFFEGAIESKGAFLVLDSKTNQIIGSSRFYELSELNSVAIGYTFISREYWGRNYNRALKSLMIDHAFQFVTNVLFHVGSMNIRSQKAMEKLGAKKNAEVKMAYYGEENNLNFIYTINKDEWERPLPAN